MNTSRRQFLGGAAASFFIGGCATKVAPRKVGPNGKVNVAIIGCGWIARFHNTPCFLKDPRCRVTVACDMVKMAPGYFYGERRSSFTGPLVAADGTYRKDVCGSTVIKSLVDKAYGDHACREVVDWRDVIDDPTIDAVCICTPDHWHAIIAIAAMKAGKHVFCQKPLSLCIRQGQEMVRVWKETGVTFQTGNQGRNNPQLRLPDELVLNGYAGKILGVTVAIPRGNHWRWHGYSKDRAPLPDYFTKETWDLWQGPAEHFENDAYIPSIHEPTCWRFNRRYGGGTIPDFGAHEMDFLQRALGMDLSGPVAVENMKTNLHDDNDIFSYASEFSFDYVYANGVRVHAINVDADHPRQCVYHTEKGDFGLIDWKKVVPKEFENFKESDFTAKDRHVYIAKNGHDDELKHEGDFLDGIFEGRQCNSTCEIGHRTITLSHLANICELLRVSRVQWEPVRETFVGPNAEAANALLDTTYHNGWELGA